MDENKITFRSSLSGVDAESKLQGAGYFCADFSDKEGMVSMPLARLGLTSADLISHVYQERIHPDDRENYLRVWKRFQEGWDNELYCEYRIRDKEGNYHWILTHALGLERDSAGKIQKIFGNDRLIETRKQAEWYLMEQFSMASKKLATLEKVQIAGKHVMADLSLTKNLYEGLRQLSLLVGFHFSAVYSKSENNYQYLAAWPAQDPQDMPDHLHHLKNMEGTLYPLVQDDLPDDGPYRSLLAIPLQTEDLHVGALLMWNRTPGFYRSADLFPILAFAEILAVAIRNSHRFQSMKKDLETDELSSFLTRKSFERTIAELWPRISNHYRHNTVVILDLDHFKAINDTWGHTTGDKVLRAVSTCMGTLVREDDVIARYGGDEFVLVLAGVDTKEAGTILERIRLKVSSLMFEGVPRGLTASIGAAVQEADEPFETLFLAADACLYQAKEQGRNRVVMAARKLKP